MKIEISLLVVENKDTGFISLRIYFKFGLNCKVFTSLKRSNVFFASRVDLNI